MGTAVDEFLLLADDLHYHIYDHGHLSSYLEWKTGRCRINRDLGRYDDQPFGQH